MNILPAPHGMCWSAGIASPLALWYRGHRLMMQEGFGVFRGDLGGEGCTCAGGAGLAPPRLPAEEHAGLALRDAALSCQAAGKAERMFVPEATGSGDSTTKMIL